MRTKQARGNTEPWLLSASVGLAHLSAATVVALYAQRMQIGESFRDTKSAYFGLGFEMNRRREGKRIAVLLLIAALALDTGAVSGASSKRPAKGLIIHSDRGSQVNLILDPRSIKVQSSRSQYFDLIASRVKLSKLFF